MGREITCEVRVGDRAFQAKVNLEGDEIIVRGPEGFRMKFEELESFAAVAGVLQLSNDRRDVELAIGGEAELWATAIREPRGRLDKLGIKPSARVVLAGELPADLLEEIARSGATIVRGGAVQLVIFAAASARELAQLDSLRELIAPSGAIWILRQKGGRGLLESELRAAARAAGLVAVKVAKISEAWTADKLIIPEKLRVGVSEAPIRRSAPGPGARPQDPAKARARAKRRALGAKRGTDTAPAQPKRGPKPGAKPSGRAISSRRGAPAGKPGGKPSGEAGRRPSRHRPLVKRGR